MVLHVFLSNHRRYIANTPIQEGGQPWKLMTFCVQTKDDAADISKRCVLLACGQKWNAAGSICSLRCSSIPAEQLEEQTASHTCHNFS